MSRRVVVSGIGIRCALGGTADEVWRAAQAGTPAAERREVGRAGTFTVFPAADPDAESAFGRREARRMDRVGAMAATVAAETLEAAGPHGLTDARIGIALGCAHGGVATLEQGATTAFERGFDRMSPLTVPLSLPNSAISATARVHGLRGPSLAIATACAAGSDAIGSATALIRDGRADAMLAGGAEAAITPLTIAGYARLGALSTADRPAMQASRPFDRGRDGFVMGEGAGLLFLEEREHALARGVTPLAEVTGYGMSCDAGHITDPDPSGGGPARAIAEALRDAGRQPSDVDYVNAHATSTPSGDLAEAHALTAAGLGNTPVSATKSLHGHTLGSAGGVEAALCVLALRDGVAPPTANLTDPESDPPLNHLPVAMFGELKTVMSNSFGFGGHNACLIFEKPDA